MARRPVIQGLKGVQKSLRKIEKETTRKSVARGALKKGGQVFIDKAETLVPEDEGDLKKSLSVGTKLSKRQRKTEKKKDDVVMYAGAGASSSAHQQEFGNVNHAPQPYMRPAYEGEKQRALAVIVDDLKKSTEATLKRQTKRNLRKKS